MAWYMAWGGAGILGFGGWLGLNGGMTGSREDLGNFFSTGLFSQPTQFSFLV